LTSAACGESPRPVARAHAVDVAARREVADARVVTCTVRFGLPYVALALAVALAWTSTFAVAVAWVPADRTTRCVWALLVVASPNSSALAEMDTTAMRVGLDKGLRNMMVTDSR
jgi:hypothetical protein